MKAGRDLLKSVWECSDIKLSCWKIAHPSNTEDERNVGLSSEDEAEGLEVAPGVARRGTGGSATPEPQPAPVPVPVQVAEDDREKESVAKDETADVGSSSRRGST